MYTWTAYSCKLQINWQSIKTATRFYYLDNDIIFSLRECNFVYGTDQKKGAWFRLSHSETIVDIRFKDLCVCAFVWESTSFISMRAIKWIIHESVFQITDIIPLTFCEFLWLILCLCNAFLRTYSFSRMHTIQPKAVRWFCLLSRMFLFPFCLLFDITVLIWSI